MPVAVRRARVRGSPGCARRAPWVGRVCGRRPREPRATAGGHGFGAPPARSPVTDTRVVGGGGPAGQGACGLVVTVLVRLAVTLPLCTALPLVVRPVRAHHG